MEKKEIFEESIDKMLEFDSGLDINDVLASLPAIEETKKDPEIKDDDKTKPEKVDLNDINKVLKTQTEEIQEDVKKTEELVDDLKDDKRASATNKIDDSSETPFTVIFAKDLVTQGLISSLDEEKLKEDIKNFGEATALRNLIKNEIDVNINTAKSDLDEGYQQYLTMIGKGVPVETASNLIELKERFETIKTEDLAKEENTQLRKGILIDYYKLTTSMSDAKIEKLVQNSIDLGDDIEDSKEFLGILKGSIKEQIASEEAEAQRVTDLRKEENRRGIETLKDHINSLDEVIPGQGINKQTKLKMYDTLVKEVRDGKGRSTNALWAKRAEDPMFFDSKLAYLLETGFFDKGKPWTKFTQTKVTKDITDLEKVLQKKNNTATTTGSYTMRTPEQEKTVKDNIDSMRGILK